MLKQYTLRMPGAVFGGEDSLDKLTNLVEDSAKVAVFTDKGIEATGLAALVTAKIEQAGKEYVVFDELPAEPSYQQAQAVIDAFKASGADFIVAVGGGSVMDIAKLASLLKTNEYGVKELLDAPLRAHKCVPTLMIPTTAGTGAEATPNAIVAVPEKEVKIGIVNSEMIADYVILDPIMIKKLPRKIAASTGVDALCHATLDGLKGYNGPYCIESFDPRVVKRIRKFAPQVLRGQLVDSYRAYRKEGANPIHAFVISHCFGNFMARPDFIAWCPDKQNWAVRLCARLGAMMVMWTALPEHDQAALEKQYDAVIFQWYHPEVKYK